MPPGAPGGILADHPQPQATVSFSNVQPRAILAPSAGAGVAKVCPKPEEETPWSTTLL
jgi:hypothetical protein